MCKYCEKHTQHGGYEVDYLSIREPSKHDRDVYTGIHSFIDLDTNELVMYACIDSCNVRPLHKQVCVPIFYCPKCGRKLGDE